MDASLACFSLEEMTGVVMILVVFGILFFLAVIPSIFYLITLQKALGRCQVQNRKMQPGLVWLMLIPFFSLIWHFIVVSHVADSLEREFACRKMVAEPLPGKSVGLAMCILNVCGLIPYIGILANIGHLVCWIVYWVKIAGCSSRLVNADFQTLDVPPIAADSTV